MIPLISISDGELPDWWSIEVADLAGTGLVATLCWQGSSYAWDLAEPIPLGGTLYNRVHFVAGQAADDCASAIAAMNQAALDWRERRDDDDDLVAALEAGATRRRP